jgi:hypothetical protein
MDVFEACDHPSHRNDLFQLIWRIGLRVKTQIRTITINAAMVKNKCGAIGMLCGYYLLIKKTSLNICSKQRILNFINKSNLTFS